MYVVRYLKLFQYSAFSKQRIIIFLPFSVIGSLLNLDFAVNMETWRLMALAFYRPLESWNIVWQMNRKCLNLTLLSLESRNIPSRNISLCIMWRILSMMHNEKCRKCTMCDFHNFGLINAGQMHCLPQRLKSTLFEIFSNGGCPKGNLPECRKKFKRCWF